MAPGRKKLAAPAEPEVLDAQAEQHTANALATLREVETASVLALSQNQALVRAVAEKVGYQLPADCTDPDLIQRDIAANMRRSVEACLEVGRGLCVLKEACAHGQFLARLEVLGINDGVARKFMQAARKFSNRSLTTDLTNAIGGQTKLFELLILDDEEIDELALTGQTGELSLDDVATMSVKELRAKLRDARAENKAQAELLTEKNAALDEERAKNKRIASVPPDEALAGLQTESTRIANDVRGGIIGQLRQALVALDRHGAEQGARPTVYMAGLVGQLMFDLTCLRDEFDLPPVDPDEHGWIDEAA